MQPPGVEQITRGAARLLRVGRNVKVHDARLQRAMRDHGDWLTELDGRIHQNLIQIDGAFEAKGTFRSAMRLQARVDAKSGALRELKGQGPAQ